MIFAKRSWGHIRALTSSFEVKSNTTLEQLIVKNLAKKVSAYCLLTILKYCINRPDMFAEKLKDGFKAKDLAAIERIVIGRGEIDLKTIRTVFAQNQHGGGKTLELKLKEQLNKNNELYLTVLINLVTYSDNIEKASKLAPADNNSSANSPVRETLVGGTASSDDALNGALQDTSNHDNSQSNGGGSNASDKEMIDASGYFLVSGDALVGVDFGRFGVFLKNIINEKTADKVWGKLADSDGYVPKGKLVDLLNFSAILMVAYVEKKKGKLNYTQDKAKMKSHMEPLVEWLTQKKLPQGKISKWDYIGQLGDWVTEYATTTN